MRFMDIDKDNCQSRTIDAISESIIAVPMLPVTYVCECGQKLIKFERSRRYWPCILPKPKAPKCPVCGNRMKKEPSLLKKLFNLIIK